LVAAKDNDNDGSGGGRVSYDVDEDAPVGRNSGSAADVGGNDSPAPASSAMDTAIANALANIDTASLADISTPMVGGAFVDPTTGFGIMQDIPGPAMQSAIDVAQAASPGFYGSQATTGDSFEGLFGNSRIMSENVFETTPVPGGPRTQRFSLAWAHYAAGLQ
jgi:hypothetical protein